MLSFLRGWILIRDWIPIILFATVFTLLYPEVLFKRETFFLFLYFGVLCLYFALEHAIVTPRWLFSEIFIPLTCLLIINGFLINGDHNGLKIVAIVSLTIIIINSVGTIKIVSSESDAVRNMVIYSVKGDIKTYQHYLKSGMASFGQVHALPFLLPILIGLAKHNSVTKMKLILLLISFFSYYFIIKTAFTTPILLATVGMLLALFVTTNMRLNLFLLGLFISLYFIFANTGVLFHFLGGKKYLFTDTFVLERINDVSNSIMSGQTTGHVKVRGDLYLTSLSTFLKHPLLGGFETNSAGGHAFILDRFAYFGLVGTVPFTVYLYYILKRVYKFIDIPLQPYFFISIMLFITLGLSKNITGIENYLYLFVVIPGLLLFSRQPLKSAYIADH